MPGHHLIYAVIRGDESIPNFETHKGPKKGPLSIDSISGGGRARTSKAGPWWCLERLGAADRADSQLDRFGISQFATT